MAKKNSSQQRAQQAKSTSSSRQAAANTPATGRAKTALHDTETSVLALSASAQEAFPGVLEDGSEPELSGASAADVIALAQEAMRRFEAATKAAEVADALAAERERLASREMEKAREERERIKDEQQQVREDKSENKTQRDEMKKREAALNERHEGLLKREADADAGFSERHRTTLEALEADLARLQDAVGERRKEAASVVTEIAAARLAWDAEQHASVRERLVALQGQEEALREQQSAADLERKSLAREARMLNDDRADLQAAAQQLADSTLARIRQERDALAAERDGLLDHLADVEPQLLRLREAQRQADGHSTPDLLDQIGALRRENDRLLSELQTRPEASAAAHLRAAEEALTASRTEASGLREEVARHEQQRASQAVAAVERDTMRREREALEASNRLLEDRLVKLGTQIKEHLITEKSAFERCATLDADARLQRAPSYTAYRSPAFKDLQQLIGIAQSRIAHGVSGLAPLFYHEETLRLFLAGLAGSRLILLEGESGTGKSSLPHAFAASLGLGYSSVAVQSNWRDRADLFGHYNSFEGQFHETPFLEHLYAASLPANEGRPYLLVLDEMNLARPEYYFADVLSKVEDQERVATKKAIAIPLHEKALAADKLPAVLRRHEGHLPLPPNVWFVGTANQDETTNRFAPKTYDRAHLMRMPRNPASLKIESVREAPVVGFEGLGEAFAAAQQAREADCATVHRALDALAPTFADCEITWGNRLERYLSRFVPVYTAAGGSVDQAADHVLSTKVLLHLEGRYDLKEANFNALLSALPSAWRNSRADVERARRRLA